MSLECIWNGIITTKADIYSLGVIIIEMITGRKISPFDIIVTSCQDFVEPVIGKWRNRFEETPGHASPELECQQIESCLQIGLSCIKIDLMERPTAKEIIEKLHRWESTNCYVSNEESSHEDKENLNILTMCISHDLGFINGRPTAAVIIYRCLLHWKSFEAERPLIFHDVIQIMSSWEIEAQDSNDKLPYWLSNSSTLLVLLRQTLKTSGAIRSTTQRLIGKMFTSTQASAQKGGGPSIQAEHPALLFKQRLTKWLEKFYGMIRDNLKKEISPLLGLCIQAPRIYRASLIKGSKSQANALVQQTLMAHWQNIVKILTNSLNVLKENYVPSFLIRKVFTQVFSFVNVQLFNSLLLRRECCSFSNGEHVKAGLAEFEQWCISGTEKYAGTSWDELKQIRQAVGFLVLHQKPKNTLQEITNHLCPVLSIQQLYRICTMFWDDKYGTHTVSSEVLSNMRVRMTEDSENAASVVFLLDDDSSIPFSVDDLSSSETEFDVTEVQIPPSILEKCAIASQKPSN